MGANAGSAVDGYRWLQIVPLRILDVYDLGYDINGGARWYSDGPNCRFDVSSVRSAPGASCGVAS